MLAAANAIRDYVSRGRGAFDAESALRDAILYQIIVIGEAAKAACAADETIVGLVPDVEWSPWARMRDRLTHQYWATDEEIVWSTACHDVEALRQALTTALDRLG
jgi:uncharacterized protein with HEPN domain